MYLYCYICKSSFLGFGGKMKTQKTLLLRKAGRTPGGHHLGVRQHPYGDIEYTHDII